MDDATKPRLSVALVYLALLLPSVLSAPAARSVCTPTCRLSSSSKLNYEEGKSYTYAFETEAVTRLLGTSEEQSKIKVKGRAVVAVQSPCDFILTVEQVAIQSPSGQAISKVDDIEGTSLRFAYHDGEVESVCVSEDDPSWSANVKRAIISMITNKMTDSGDTIESDVSGKCPTTYEVSGNTYKKVRNLNSCTHRDGGVSVLLGVPYDVSSNYNSAPTIDSNLFCTQEIKDGVFDSVTCQEDHRVPFLSTSNTGIHTNIKSTLKLLETTVGIAKVKNSPKIRSTLFYDHSGKQDVQRRKASASRAVDYVNKICEEVKTGTVSSKVPGLHLQLIKALKSARKDDVKQIYDKINSGGICSNAKDKLMSLFLDAAAIASSDGTIAFLAEIMGTGQAQCHTKSIFNMYTSFAAYPGIESMGAMESLISNSDVEPEHLLTASALAHQYCKTTDKNCGSRNEYHSLVDKIAQHVRKPSSEEEVNRVIVALQALGNIDHLTPTAVSVINGLLNDAEIPERVAIRALDAFRRDPCEQQLKQKGWSMLMNPKISTHVRIQAYLTVSKCIDQSDITNLQDFLSVEKSNQVGSFVMSHIENILESESPNKQDLRDALESIKIAQGFPKDARRFSRNVELSSFSAKENLGGEFDGNLVFSQDSYIPRMLSANVSLYAFGRGYNILEVGMYGEGFEHLAEKVLGPVGIVEKSNLKQMISDGTSKFSNLISRLRSRREVRSEPNQNEIDEIIEKTDMDERTGDHGVGDIYIRVMGTTIMVDNFDETNLRHGPIVGKLSRSLQRFMEGAKDYKTDLTEPMIFLDDELVVPTFSGLPLNFELKGTTILSLQMSGNMDIQSLIRGDEVTDMRSKIIPSAASVFRGRITVGTGPMESGIQVEAKIHSAAGVDMKAVREEGKLEVRFNLPEERTQIIDVRSDVYWVQQPQDSLEIKTQVQSKLESRTFVDNQCTTAFTKPLGLKMCMDAKFPKASDSAPHHMLNGPSAFSLYIEKSEPSMEGYYLKIEKNSPDSESFGVDIHLDTPGSRTNRKILTSIRGLNYRSKTPEYSLKIDSPWTNLDLNYKRSYTDNLKGIELNLVKDESTYNTKIQLKKTTAGRISKYEPIIQYTLPKGKPVNVIEGKVIYISDQRKYDLDLKSAGPLKPMKASIKGAVEFPMRENGFSIVLDNLEMTSEVSGKLKLDGSYIVEAQLLKSKMNIVYGRTKEDVIDYEYKIGFPQPREFILEAKFESTEKPHFNFNLNGKVKNTENALDAGWEFQSLKYEDIKAKHKLTFEAKSIRDFEIFHEFLASVPAYKVDVYTKLDAKAAPSEPRHADFILNAGDFKSNASYQSDGINPLDFEVAALAEYDGTKFEFSEVSTKVNDEKQNIKARIAVTPGFWYEASTDLKYKMTPSDMDLMVASTITSDQLDHPIVWKAGVRGNTQSTQGLIKVDLNGNNYIDFHGQYKTGDPKSITMKGYVLDYFETKLASTFSKDSNTIKWDAKWVPSGRKIEARSNVVRKGDLFDINAGLKWDAERDPSKSVILKSLTKLSCSDAMEIDSKNNIKILESTSKFNVDAKAFKDFLNGQNHLNLEYVSSDEKRYAIQSELTLENQAAVKAGTATLKLELPQEAPYELKLSNRVTDIDYANLLFNMASTLDLSYKGENNVNVKAEVASLKPQNFRTLYGKVAVDGSALTTPFETELKADVKKGKVAIDGNAKAGNDVGKLDLTLEYDTWSPKKTLSVTYDISTPFKSVSKMTGHEKYAVMANSWTDFEVTGISTVKINDEKPFEWEYKTSLLSNEFNIGTSFKIEDEHVYDFGLDSTLTDDKLMTNVKALYGKEKSSMKMDVTYGFPNVGIHVKGFNLQSSFEFEATHSQPSTYVREFDVMTKYKESLIFRLSNKFEVSPDQKAMDVIISTKDQPNKILHLLFNHANPKKMVAECSAKWGEGAKHFGVKGNILRSSEGFKVNALVDSPTLTAKKLQVDFSKNKQDNRHNLELNVKEEGSDLFSAVADFGSSSKSSYLTIYDGSVEVKDAAFNNFNFNGKFRIEDSKLSIQRDNEVGRQLKGQVELGEGSSLKATAVLKSSDKENRAQASFCRSNDHCSSGDVHFRHNHEDNGNMEYTMRILAHTNTPNDKSSRGIIVNTVKTGKQYDHTVKLILRQEDSDNIGYRVYADGVKEYGVEVLLPERTMATVLILDHPTPKDIDMDLSFYVDKLRKPNRKVSFIVESTQKSKESGTSRNTNIIFRHPDLEKDLKISSHYVISSEGDLTELKAILDVFKPNKEIAFSYKTDEVKVAEGRLHNSHWFVKSKDKRINFGGKYVVSQGKNELAVVHDFYYQDRDGEMQEGKVETFFSPSRVSYNLEFKEEKVVSLITVFESHATGYEYRQEILLPYMEDARVFQAVLKTASPQKLHFKTYTSNSPAHEYYEGIFGLRNENEFVIGAYDHDSDGEKVLADFTVSLNSTKMLNVKTNWEKDNLCNVWDKIKARNDRNGRAAKTQLIVGTEEIVQELQHIIKSFQKITPNMQPAIEASKEQLRELTNELEAHEDTKLLMDQYQMGKVYFRKLARSLYALSKIIGRLTVVGLRSLRDSMLKIPEILKEYGSKISWDEIHQYLNRLNEMMQEYGRMAYNILADYMDNLSKLMPLVMEQVDWLVEVTADMREDFMDMLATAVTKMSVLWEKAGKLATAIGEHPVVKKVLKDVTSIISLVLYEFLDETVEHAVAFKEYVLETVPEKEFQDIVQAVVEYLEKKSRGQEVDDMVAIKEIYEKLESFVRKIASEYLTIDLENGFLAAQIPLPISIEKLSDITSITNKLSFPTPPRISYKLPAYQYGIQETINKLKHGASFNEVFPPFDGYALIVGSRFYKTFDGQYFEFGGGCQYLLAADYEDRNFTIVGDIDNDALRKYITVKDSEDTITIKPDYKVQINGALTPITEKVTVGAFTVETMGDWILITGERGVKVGCSKLYDVCAIKVNGFYHGKVLGLLGKFNHEVYDDLNHYEEENVVEFANQFNIVPRCKSRTEITEVAKVDSCDSVFHSKYSPLRPCYGVVPVKEYYNMCQKLSGLSEFGERKGKCTAVTAYAKACKLSFAPVDMPVECH